MSLRKHPFWVEAEQAWVPLGELAEGDVLTTDGGGEAVVVGLTVRPGSHEVFNIEVAGPHNYFVRADGSDGPGVLVHNKNGSYTVFFKNGCRYHGKGPLDRAWGSAKRLESQGGGVRWVSWSPAVDERVGYLQEWSRMLADVAWMKLCKGKRYNKIRQPGRTRTLDPYEWPIVD